MQAGATCFATWSRLVKSCQVNVAHHACSVMLPMSIDSRHMLIKGIHNSFLQDLECNRRGTEIEVLKCSKSILKALMVIVRCSLISKIPTCPKPVNPKPSSFPDT